MSVCVLTGCGARANMGCAVLLGSNPVLCITQQQWAFMLTMSEGSRSSVISCMLGLSMRSRLDT